ncbi:unnamed protein product [Ranitomeya imitator]|uniref:UBX domain-containing protein n=1 Tax=Ranitomeya imitator TaxID=111125 RepID=A0ABN9MIX5_9NEOB|nr:unnamed protein product [Ranitomeya imitator]
MSRSCDRDVIIGPAHTSPGTTGSCRLQWSGPRNVARSGKGGGRCHRIPEFHSEEVHRPPYWDTQVTDMRSVVFRERTSWDLFPGQGQSVGRAEKNQPETSEIPGPLLSVQQFLNRLPKSVIQGGRVIDIQGPIRYNLLGPKADEKTQETLVESPLLLSMNKGSQSNAVVCTLRIKSEPGDRTYKVQMSPAETIGDLRALLSLHESCDVSSCDIISGFPHRVYDNYSCTLQDAGLVPNALLLLRRKKPKDAENTRNFS